MGGERQSENFRRWMWATAGGGEGERSRTKEVRKRGDTEEKGKVVVVRRRKEHYETASGTAESGLQAQSEARGRCKGPISGSTRDPALHNVQLFNAGTREMVAIDTLQEVRYAFGLSIFVNLALWL